MNIKQIKYELQNVLSGKSNNSYNAPIQTISRLLRSNEKASPMAERKHQNKEQETKQIIEFARSNEWIYDSINEEDFVSSGAEQKVYIKNKRQVIKLNDAIYYASWEDYFHNLLLHNFFFSDTAYKLVGFHISDESNCYAVVQQPYVETDRMTKLSDVKDFLTSNGFENTRNHDYYHPELGIILEDLHDENVLMKKGVMYFIDTVFYVKPEIFWG